MTDGKEKKSGKVRPVGYLSKDGIISAIYKQSDLVTLQLDGGWQVSSEAAYLAQIRRARKTSNPPGVLPKRITPRVK